MAGIRLDGFVPRFDFLWSTTFWIYTFWILWLHRYVRLLVHCCSHWRYKSKPIPAKPRFTSRDVTVVIPTIHNVFEELRPSLQSILACNPFELILVTTVYKKEALEKLAATLKAPGVNIKVLYTNIANKRLQVCEALPQVRTDITIMADDDVTWPPKLMDWILAPFEDPKIGGVGTCQRVKRVWDGDWSTRIWNWLGAAYIERRNFEISATHNIDGGTSCMSGRTGAYRSEILQSHDFLEGFKTERWGKFILNADDDNFVTRWLVSHQWKTWIQYERECELETTLENGLKFLYQCSRWARSNWRSNWTSLVTEQYVWNTLFHTHTLTPVVSLLISIFLVLLWTPSFLTPVSPSVTPSPIASVLALTLTDFIFIHRQQPWCTYALHVATFTSLAFVVDPLLLASCWWATANWELASRQYAFWAQFIFMFGFTKVVKLMGLFMRNPSDIKFLPVSIVFGYFHGLIKLYALFTLRMTSWGSRADGDANDESRLTPRPVRSASLTTPPGRHPGLPHHVREELGLKGDLDEKHLVSERTPAWDKTSEKPATLVTGQA